MITEAILRELAAKASGIDIYPDARFPPSLYYRFLRVLAKYMQPGLSVELGVCGGGGSLHLALGCSLGKVVGVDNTLPADGRLEAVQQACPNFEFWLGDTVESAARIYEKYGLVDILFIDSTHTYEQTLAEVSAWKPYLSDKAVVCFDDLFRSGVEQLWNELSGNKVRLDEVNCTAGFGAWQPCA